MAPLRSTRAGRVEGVRLGAVDAFLGIPYAAPPVGIDRFRAPQPVAPWAGVRAATTFGPSCWQAVEPKGFGPWTPEYVVQGNVSEDCLYLNVWAPADRAGERRPVLVWIHGGAFCQGSGSVAIYDGRPLASQGVVVVSINYRLGVLGFLAHSDLALESGTPVGYGNFGLQDQIAALRWVQANIAAFGGDPDAVTVAGQSAGAVSVHMLVSSPRAVGLFHRAIAQSGPPTLVPVKPREQAEADGLAFAAELGAPDVQALRALSVQELTRTLEPGLRFGPMVDGVVLPSWPPQLRSAEGVSDVPMIVGQTADEISGLAPDHEQGDTAYRAASRERWLAALWHWADHCRAGAPTFAYLFDHVQPGPDAVRYGAFHTSDVPYALATLDAAPQRTFTEVDRQVCALMSGYWLHFVKNGSPNGHGLPQWPALDSGAPIMLRIGAQAEPVAMFPPTTLAAIQKRVRGAGWPTVLP